MTADNRNSIEPEKTPLFIGTGVSFQGSFTHNGPVDEKAVILGEFTGDMQWNGVLQVPRGGKIIVQNSLRCREMVVGGQIVGADESVLIETGLLRLGESAVVDVATVSLPAGGLEQSRGSVINAKLRMSKDHPFAELHNDDRAGDELAGKVAMLRLAVTPARSADADADHGQLDEPSSLAA